MNNKKGLSNKYQSGRGRRYVLPLMLALILTAMTVLAGCGDGNQSGSTKAPDTSAAQSQDKTDNTGNGSADQSSEAGNDGTGASDKATEATEGPETEQTQPQTQTGDNSGAPKGDGSSEVSAVFHLDLLENKGLQDYEDSKINEIIVDPDGSSFVFWTTKTLKDLKLIGVEYNGDQFLEGKVYCSYDEFTSADVILLTHSFPESMPDLKLTFYDEVGTLQTFYISQSGQDGSPLLVTEEALLFGN